MKNFPIRFDIGLLVLRVGLGLTFLMHGYQKVFTFGFAGVAGAFTKMGAPMPGFTGPAVALLELLGGIAILLGIFTRVFGFLLACDMLGAIALVHGKNGFFMPTGMELVFVLAAMALTLVFTGAGPLSVDARMTRAT